MEEFLVINNSNLQIKTIEKQRVVTFADIDKVHKRKAETARFRFNNNKEHFIKDTDYFILKPSDFQMCVFHTSGIEKRRYK